MKLVAFSEKYSIELQVKKVKLTSEIKRHLLNILNQEKDKDEPPYTRIECLDNKHICKYCGGIAESTYKDLLCKNCRELFGHSLYSEL